MLKHPIEQCDVNDKEKLYLFRAAMTKWVRWLSGDDIHAIWQQIYGLFWRDSLFRLVNETRQLAEDSPLSEIGFNGPVIDLFDAGFACVQAMTIRRLNEPQAAKSNKEVVSLRALIDDIEFQRELLTRENYVCDDDVPFDHQKAFSIWQSKHPNNRVGIIPNKGEEAWSKSGSFHKFFDRLSGVKPEFRSRSDVVSPEIFKTLKTKLKICDDVEMHTHKFIAHAADPQNRQQLTKQQETLTLEKFNACCKEIFLVADFLTLLLTKTSHHSPIPQPQYSHLENLDKAWALSSSLRDLHQGWLDREREVQSWRQDLRMIEAT